MGSKGVGTIYKIWASLGTPFTPSIELSGKEIILGSSNWTINEGNDPLRDSLDQLFGGFQWRSHRVILATWFNFWMVHLLVRL